MKEFNKTDIINHEIKGIEYNEFAEEYFITLDNGVKLWINLVVGD